MTYRIFFLQTIITLFFGIFLPQQVFALQKQMPMHMQDMEKEIAEANKAIEEYIANLPPDLAADFNRQVEEYSQMFENMDDAEFEKFLGEMFNEGPMPEPDFSQIPAPLMEEEVIEVSQVNIEQLKKVDAVIVVLNDIIKQSNMFMTLISSSPELPNRINNWAKKGIISNWQEGATWDTLKIDLEYFIQKLYKIQEQDLTTKEYRYLLDLLADEALYNNIIQLRTSLNSLLPIINIPEFGIQKINAQSKDAIKNILQKYTESFYLLAIPKALDALFEKYEPHAKKIRESEAHATRRALEASREPRSPAEATVAGAEPDMGYDSYGGYGGYDSYGYGGDYGSPYYGGGYGGYGNDYGGGYGGGSDYGSSPAGGSSGSTGGGGKSSGGGSKSGGSASEKPSDEKKEEKEKEKAEEYIPNDEITEIIGRIKNNLETINGTITGEDYPQLKDLVTHIQTQDVSNDLANYILPTVINKNVIALSDNIKKIDDLSKKINSVTLKTYQTEIKKIFAKNKPELEKLSKDITAFDPQTESEKKAAEEATKSGVIVPVKVDIATLPLKKKWAYFADTTAEEALKTSTDPVENDFVEKEVVHPKDLREIKKNIDKLFKDVKTFGEKKATKSAAKKAVAPVATPAE